MSDSEREQYGRLMYESQDANAHYSPFAVQPDTYRERYVEGADTFIAAAGPVSLAEVGDLQQRIATLEKDLKHARVEANHWFNNGGDDEERYRDAWEMTHPCGSDGWEVEGSGGEGGPGCRRCITTRQNNAAGGLVPLAEVRAIVDSAGYDEEKNPAINGIIAAAWIYDKIDERLGEED